VFVHLLGYAGQIVHSGASGVQNIETLIFMLVWDRYRFLKKCVGIPYNELVFLPSVGYVCQEVLCSESGA
jgi:hypothetical protein